jgi:ABC-2 type transport system permease protein
VTDTPPAPRFIAAPAPTLPMALRALLEADLVVQLRNMRAVALSTVLPVVLLFATFAVKRAAALGDPRFKVAACVTLGVATIALIGYSMSVARDREAGVFQRLRVTPTPVWAIMASRLAIQVLAILVMAVVVLVAAAAFKSVTLDAGGYVLTLVAVVFAAAMFLSIGQALVGLIRSTDTLSAVSRLVYIPTFALGLLGHTDILGTTFETIARWSPGGAVSTMLGGAMSPTTWNGETWAAVLVVLAYAIAFAGAGIRWFQWTAS